ncbi:hypothetical protein FH972_012545 [Carpinus fangiana]|uniref:RNA helicase n=1 Tax=Carpinus fangiana TaxID=176857 RepID=A0A5N6R5M5_9ROSI|nr:hypothetical protein FH972_012545 [Carpinus fangiana]
MSSPLPVIWMLLVSGGPPSAPEDKDEANPKRKLQETEPQEAQKEKKKKKDKKGDDAETETHEGKVETQRNDGVDDGEPVRDGHVVVTGKNVESAKYAPLKSFAKSRLPEEVLECCKNFQSPSLIQSRAWPFLLDDRDFIGIAATGSGKTLAFGVPAIMHVLNKRKGKMSKGRWPLCLVLSPTRELAQQDIVIGTPGRLKDLIEMGVCILKEVSFVVLDEADRMLDMGFEQEVRSILGQTCSARQMVMFSATWPLLVHQLAQEFMDPNPVKVLFFVHVLDDRSRDQCLVALLEKYHKSKRNRVLVFVLYKLEVKCVENMLQEGGWKAVSIHGDKAQNERTKALSLFKKGSCPLMESKLYGAHFKEIPIDAPKSKMITFDNSDDDD